MSAPASHLRVCSHSGSVTARIPAFTFCAIWRRRKRRTPCFVAPVSGSAGEGRFARLEGSPTLFALGPEVIAAIVAEPRVKQLMSVDPAAIQELQLGLPEGRVEARRSGPATPPRFMSTIGP